MKLEELGLTQETFSLNLEANRKATFTSWPFDSEDCSCTSKQLAEAGFFHVPSDKEPDLVRCYVCLKELEGWEPEDDPWYDFYRFYYNFKSNHVSNPARFPRTAQCS